jgi:hypothetical protein
MASTPARHAPRGGRQGALPTQRTRRGARYQRSASRPRGSRPRRAPPAAAAHSERPVRAGRREMRGLRRAAAGGAAVASTLGSSNCGGSGGGGSGASASGVLGQVHTRRYTSSGMPTTLLPGKNRATSAACPRGRGPLLRPGEGQHKQYGRSSRASQRRAGGEAGGGGGWARQARPVGLCGQAVNQAAPRRGRFHAVAREEGVHGDHAFRCDAHVRPQGLLTRLDDAHDLQQGWRQMAQPRS